MAYDTAIEQWREGVRRLEEAPPQQREVLERVVTRIVRELRRKLGAGSIRTVHGIGYALDTNGFL
jgi:DNA-binding response OmpR family regulator